MAATPQQLGGSPDPPDPAVRLMCSTCPVLVQGQGTQRHSALVLPPGRDSGLEGIQNDYPYGFPGAERVSEFSSKIEDVLDKCTENPRSS